MQTQPTTPFGRRQLSLAMVASQTATEDFAARPGATEAVVHKWRLFRALTEAKEQLKVTDRALSVLHALLSFHQETALTLPTSDQRRAKLDSSVPGIVVFPSNKELSHPRSRHGAGDAATASRLSRRRRADHPPRLCRTANASPGEGRGARSRTPSASTSRRSSRAPRRSKTSPRRCAPRTAQWRCCAKRSR